MNVTDIRRLTPATENYAYFQTSGFSPKPEPVIRERGALHVRALIRATAIRAPTPSTQTPP
jgi:hypothetical protein